MQYKKCTKCGEFYPASTEYFHKQKRGYFELTSWCKSCFHDYASTYRKANKEKVNSMNKLWRDTHPRNKKKHMLKYLYGMTIEDYEHLLYSQDGVCAICGKPETELHNDGGSKSLTVDHNHKTGKVRGLLCGRCNRVLGLLNDDYELLKSCLDYLEKE